MSTTGSNDNNLAEPVMKEERIMAAKKRPTPLDDGEVTHPLNTTKLEGEPMPSKKRPAPVEDAEAADPLDQPFPSPAPSAPIATPNPKRPRLTEPTPQNTTPSRASITATLTHPPPKTPKQKRPRKKQLATDPVNGTIYELRRQALDWHDIADRTNAACALSEAAEVTAAACYSRFYRNGPLVARERGEEWKREWYVNMSGPVAAVAVQERDERVEEAVVRAVEVVKGEFWSRVKMVVEGGLEKGKGDER